MRDFGHIKNIVPCHSISSSLIKVKENNNLKFKKI